MNRGIKITLKDLRISKAHKIPKVKPCTMEMDNYIRALERDNPKTVSVLSKLLFECMEKHVSIIHIHLQLQVI